jgi:murein DD-endopeptidase MepM/ murein hydrolase activator NlpD
VSTPTALLPGETEGERLPDDEIAAEAAVTISEIEDFLLPARRAARRRKRFRLSQKWRLARTGLFLLALGVTLSSVGVLPGNGWPLSLFGGHQAGATTNAVIGIAPTGAPSARPSSPVTKPAAQPALWAFATAKGLTVYVPTHRLLGIGYHEAATQEALRLTPLGRCVADDNKGRIRKPAATQGPDYVILETRYRRQGPTTAADIAMPKGATVLAPISGRVVQVSPYRLYKYWLDYRVVIRPGGSSRLEVVMIHLTDLRVHKGQLVVAGVTPIGHPRVFSFKSDINDYVGAGVPHVHLEVKDIGPSRRTA